MTWRWDSDAAYDVAEAHGQHVEGSLDSYDWDGFDAAGRILLAAIDSVLELLPDYTLRNGSTVHVRAEEAGDSIVHSATHSSGAAA